MLTITRRNAVLSAVWLTVALLGVAGIFLLQGAEFLFVSQIILYIGGIALLFLFVIMLVNLGASQGLRQFQRIWPILVPVGVVLASELIVAIVRSPQLLQPGTVPPASNNAELLADVLLSRYFVSFEVLSVLLLVAIVGPVWLGQSRKRSQAGAIH